MKKSLSIKILFLIIFIAIISIVPNKVKAYSYEGKFDYEINNGEITITAAKYNEKEFSIPSTIDGCNVTKIGNDAFFNRQCTIVNLPNTITTIGDSAFYMCKYLEEINIPDNVITIEGGAFASCKKLRQINIPNSVETIGEFAFAYCESLTSIDIPDKVTIISEHLFLDCKNLKNVNCMGKIKEIGLQAFERMHIY